MFTRTGVDGLSTTCDINHAFVRLQLNPAGLWLELVLWHALVLAAWHVSTHAMQLTNSPASSTKGSQQLVKVTNVFD
jgi:hypothetical protein